MAEIAKFRREEESPFQNSIRELRRNTAGVGAVAANVAGIPSRGLRQLTDYFIAQPAAALAEDLSTLDLTAGRQSNPYGFPESSVREMERVRRQLNPGGAGVVTETVAPAAATAVAQIPTSFRQAATAAPAPPAASPPSTAPELQTGNRDTGYRIVTSPSGRRVLTNLTEGRAIAADLNPGNDFIEADGRRTEALGGGFRNMSRQQAQRVGLGGAYVTADEAAVASAPAPGRPLRSLGNGQLDGRLDVVLGGTRDLLYGSAKGPAAKFGQDLRSLAVARGQAQVRKTEAEAGALAATASTGGLKTQAEIAKINKELGINLKPYYTKVTDPKTLQETSVLAGFVSEGGATPVDIPLADYQAFQRARLAAKTPEERLFIEKSFRDEFQLGG